MATVAITGVSGALGRRIVSALAERTDWSVVGIDTAWFPAGIAKPRRFVVHNVDLRQVDVAALFVGADAIVHLADDDPDSPTFGDLTVLRRVLDGATSAGVRHLVAVSTAAVYGAWPDNPVPLTEEAPLRPNPGFAYAEHKVSVERLLRAWRNGPSDGSRPQPPVSGNAGSTRALTILRPTVTLGHPEAKAWLARAVRPTLAHRLGQEPPPMQFVHVDDVASAIIHAIDLRLDDTFNVAPEGWLSADEIHELLGPALRLPVPERASELLARLPDGPGASVRSDAALAYTKAPWVVAADRLRATGWVPRSSNAEAYVANRRPSEIGRFVARHRQEVTLGAVATVGAAATGALAWAATRLRRR